MSTSNRGTRYDEDFKRTLVNLYQSGGKSQAALCREYGIAPMTVNYPVIELPRASEFRLLRSYYLRVRP